ncbi:MAG: hypothetical protein GEV11_24130 [Streptosporangiales bacterium]|nr:hypothetical protein [Streptosporangiales bacterium]
MQFFDEHVYSLRTPHLQIGLPAPIHPDIRTDARRWRGWDRFDEQPRHGLFVVARPGDATAWELFHGILPVPPQATAAGHPLDGASGRPMARRAAGPHSVARHGCPPSSAGGRASS